MQLYASKFLRSLFNHVVFYPTPANLNYFWNFGSLAGSLLLIQIVSGLSLSMHYCPDSDLAFLSVEHIMRDVNKGWFIRYLHSNGASFFFIVIYLHIGRSLYYRSYQGNYLTWASGIIIFFLSMAIAFLGYVLPWGQMSFWGATVITNLFSAIPYIGKTISQFFWGGFSVGNPTLNRFFSLHFVLPFILVGAVMLHLMFLHENGSTALVSYKTDDLVNFFPYFFVKDLLGFLIMLFCLITVICFYPNVLGHPDNHIEANPLVTPEHIVPEWYFLPFHAISRSIPDKLGGVIYMFLSILVFFLINVFEDSYAFSLRGFSDNDDLVEGELYSNSTDPKFSFWSQVLFWSFVSVFAILGWIGSMPAKEPYTSGALFFTLLYFFILTVLYPIILTLDKIRINIDLKRNKIDVIDLNKLNFVARLLKKLSNKES